MPAPDVQTYTNQVLKLVVAQICQTLGFNSVQSTPMEVMIDVLHNYMREICKLTKDYAELYNRTEPNIDDVALAYREMKINLNELKEYVEFIDPIACPAPISKYPIPKESHLNFLKPGSQEVLTRPNHIPDYLPPMQPPEEEEEMPSTSSSSGGDIKPIIEGGVATGDEVDIKEEKVTSPPLPGAPFFKKPPDLVDRKVKFEQEGRPVREISSVMMTTSGFISPAREGKLPDAKPPVIVPDKRQSPPPPPPVAAPLPVTSLDSKFEEKPAKKKEKEEKKKKVKKEHPPAPPPPVAIPSVPSLPAPAPIPIPSTSSGAKMLPHIPPHSIASQVTPTAPIAVRPLTPRKPGRPPKNRAPDGTPLPPTKPKKPKNTDAKVLKQLKKDITAGRLPPMPEHQLKEMLKKYKPPITPMPPSQTSSTPLSQAHQFLTGQAPLPQFGNPLQFPSPHKFNPVAFSQMMMEGKLPSEPDKSKLNFFKKMPSAKSSLQMPGPSDYSSPLVPKLEPPSHIDETTPPMNKKRPDYIDTNSPLNMSMHRPHQPDFGRSPNEDLALPKTPQFMPRTPDVKMSPWMKEEKKKEKKPKKDKNLPHMMPFYGHNPNIPDFPGTSRGGINPNLLSSFGSFGQPNMRFPFFPNLMPAGPGLIPTNNPLIPQFGGSGLPGMPFGMAGLFPGLGQMPKIRDPSPTKDKNREQQQMSLEMNKPHCNVAPLIPKSLDISPVPKSESPILKLPPETIAIPINDNLPHERRPSPMRDALSITPSLTPTPPILPATTVAVPERSVSHNPSGHVDDDFDTIDLTSPPPPPQQLQAQAAPLMDVSSVKPEKSEKKKDKEHKKEKKDKDKMKKKKKQKDKDRERGERGESGERKEKSKKHKKEKRKEKERLAFEANKLVSSNTDSVDASDSSMGSVPKLTLKLPGFTGSRPNTPDVPKKLSTKFKKKESDSHSDTFSEIGSSPQLPFARESSPELAKISALVTHPPKQKTHKRKHDDDLFSGDERPSTSKHIIKSPSHEQKKKKHKSNSPVATAVAPSTPKAALSTTEIRDTGEEQKVWICPACAQVDNGTPMIGCDSCDAWYHWECVGIQVPPDESENWYCRACISRKQDSYSGEKKKKRKKNKDKSADK